MKKAQIYIYIYILHRFGAVTCLKPGVLPSFLCHGVVSANSPQLAAPAAEELRDAFASLRRIRQAQGLGFRVWCLLFGVWGLGFGVYELHLQYCIGVTLF